MPGLRRANTNKSSMKTKTQTKTCAGCISCIRLYDGCECALTDNAINETQEACVDFIPEDPSYGEEE